LTVVAQKLGSFLRAWIWALLSVVVLFNLLGFFGVPALLRYVAEHQLSAELSRPVTVGKIRFNPYTLQLDIEQFHLGDANGTDAFVDFAHLMINASWESLFRLSPVVQELSLDSPQIRIVRTQAQHFNFTDLIEKFSQPSGE
jgi:uncharacterized protein involved in outer membrane biogenesis